MGDDVPQERFLELMTRQVFLGGACGRTTWRHEIAIPRLQTAGITFHNPQLGVNEWTPAQEAAEMEAKDEAEVLLFVIHESTRGVASVAEASYLIGLGRPLALVVRMIPEGADWVHPAEREDLNRGRIFVRTMAGAHGVPVFARIEDAVEYTIQLVNNAKRIRAILGDVECPGVRFEAEPLNGGFHIRVLGPEGMEGRRWHVPASAEESDIVRTAFKAVVTWQEHETREMFRYRGVALFGPHIDVQELLRIQHP